MKSKKISTIIVSAFTLTALALALAATYFLQTEFNKIEHENVSRDVDRAERALNNQVETFSTQATDWATWDDTYAFIKNHNAAYIESNLTNSSLQNIGVNFMLFINASGKLVESKGVDVDTGEDLEVPSSLTYAFRAGSPLLSTSEETSKKGYIESSGKLVLFATRPILNSNGEGPYRGTLVFARYLLPSQEEELSKTTALSASYRLIDGGLTDDTRRALPVLTAGSTAVRVLPGKKVAGYRSIKDVYGQPLFVVRVESSRAMYAEAQEALLFYLAGLVLIVTLAAVTSIYTTRQVVKRDKIIRLKDQFFSVASHEIRTPLTAIRGNSQMLQEFYGPSQDADFKQMTDDIHTSSVRLIKLVTDFLELARLEQDRMPLQIEDFALSGPVDAVMEEMQSVAKEHKIRIGAKLPPGPIAVHADQDRVKQVLYNLIGNSLKFTEKGSITVTAAQEGKMVVIRVADTGRGISPEKQQILFRKFEQTTKGDELAGSGLGLYISKMLVEKMGGRIRLESSKEGNGTVISFSVPIARPAKPV